MDRSKPTPGGPSGVSAILSEKFGVGPTPSMTRSEVLARVEHELAERGIPYDSLSVSDTPLRRNSLVDAGGRRVRFPEGKPYDRCFVALVDCDAEARWAHQAYWAFVPADGTGPVVLCETQWPEHPRGRARLYAVQ